jgi:hypothetical protein
MKTMPACLVCKRNDLVTCSVDPAVTALNFVVKVALFGPLTAPSLWPQIARSLPSGKVYFCSRDGHKWTERPVQS